MMRVNAHWRVYLRGDVPAPATGQYIWREFGIDYPTLQEAQEAKAAYSQHFPSAVYRIRKHKGRGFGRRVNALLVWQYDPSDGKLIEHRLTTDEPETTLCGLLPYSTTNPDESEDEWFVDHDVARKEIKRCKGCRIVTRKYAQHA